ncbi:MAG: DUF2075 domain-containing protein [Clostridia bacterium]|nr:DUF2075 domain-containing protein [Clostridia bacterium]
MIVYSGNKYSFQRDVINGNVARRLDDLFVEMGIRRESLAEFNSWKASLQRMALIMADSRIHNDVQVALEYQIPLTSKRVDFMVGGSDGSKDNVVIVELKQWEKCQATSRENVVIAFTGGANREVAHPSQQAYSYAKLIEHFNESVRENNIGLVPCAYLHNYQEAYRDQICHEKYSEAIKDAPAFLEQDGMELAEFIVKHASKPSDKKLFEIIEHGKLKPSKSLQETVGSVLNGNEEFEMIDEQQVAYATVLKLVQNTIKDNKKHTIIVQGGPGTGKSVIAINLLAKIINNAYSAIYVTKNGAPRFTFSQSLIKGRYKLSYLKGLFKSSGGFYEAPQDIYDCILVDEAHRLNLKSGLYGNQGENQVKEIINAAKISVFFVDEDQIVTMKDIGTVEEIKTQAEALGSVVHYGQSLKLTSQFRCNGSDGYIAFLDDALQIRSTANARYFDGEYDIQIFDNPCEMREALRLKNTRNKARMIAGYCYPWVSDNDKSLIDIKLPDGFEAQWNFNTNEFATHENSFEQVGCIHSTQGLEFDYVGIIIGKDMRYEDGKVITDYNQRYLKRDKTIQNVKTDEDRKLADRIIRNTYKTLLSRGQKGCYIYCEDAKLRDYLRLRLEQVTRKQQEVPHDTANHR